MLWVRMGRRVGLWKVAMRILGNEDRGEVRPEGDQPAAAAAAGDDAVEGVGE